MMTNMNTETVEAISFKLELEKFEGKLKKREVGEGEDQGPKIVRAKSFAAMHSPASSNTNLMSPGSAKPAGSTSNLLSPMSLLAGIGKKNRY